MKTNWIVGSVFLAGAMVLQAQTNDLGAVLRQGLFEEEANRNLDAAISNYQALATQFDQDRQIAATAIFRLGECYRKLGQTNDAVVEYQRIIREFPDQPTLATLSQQNLAGLGAASQPRFQERLQAIIAKSQQDTTSPMTDGEDLEIRRIQQLIQNSPDLINALPPSSDFTPLGDAARNGQIKVAAFLLDHGAGVNVVQRDGETALHSAARAGNRAMVELLLSRGADVNATADNGQTPLCLAVDKGFQAVTEVLLANKAEVNVADKNMGNTPLHLAAKGGRAKIIQLLLAAGANPTAESKRGRTPLSFAAENGSPESMKLLLAAQADPNGGKLDPPLLCAINKQDLASAELLLENGANPNLKGSVDWQATIGFTVYSGKNPTDRAACTPLYLAVSTEQLPMINLLVKFKADPNDSQTDGRPLLFSALSNPDMLEALLAAGGKADSRDAGGWPLLTSAIWGNNPAMVKTILQHGADANIRNRHGGDQGGFTPLHVAAFQSADRSIFEMLLDDRADPNVRSDQGSTPLGLVKMKQASSVDPQKKAAAGWLADLLRRHGALDNLPNWDQIAVSRPSANYSQTIFEKGTNDWNRFTLLEMLLQIYREPSPRFPRFGGMSSEMPLPFPDLARLTIIRHRQNTTNETRLQVNLLNATNGIDCSKDVPLEFGDVVEIPEREHALGDKPVGLTPGQSESITNALKGSVRLEVHGRKVELPVYPTDSSLIGSVLNRPEAQDVLLSSSDLSRVKVIRADPVTGKQREWILDCSRMTHPENNPFPPGQMNDPYYHAPGLRLRAGDVIEVPER